MRRFSFLLVAFLAILSVFAVIACHPESDYKDPCPGTGGPRRFVIDGINYERAQRGLGQLFCNQYAMDKAQDWSYKQATKQVSGHSTLANGYPSSAQWGHQYWGWLGENICTNYRGNARYPEFDRQSLDGCIDLWLGSQSHRDVMLAPRAKWIGVGMEYGCVCGSVGGGTNWEDYIFVTLEMGDPCNDGDPPC